MTSSYSRALIWNLIVEKHTLHRACLEGVWYFTQMWEVVTPHGYYFTIKHWRILQFKKTWHNNFQQTPIHTSQFFSSLYSSIQPCTLLPSSPLFLPFLALSQASPSILPFLPCHITHRLPFPPIYQQMQMFIILANTFDNSCEQLKGLQKRRMKLHLAIGGSIMTYFSLFPAGEKLTCFTLFLSFFNQKR